MTRRFLSGFGIGVWMAAYAASSPLAAAPELTEVQKVEAWLQKSIGIAPERIVLLSPNVLVALKTIEPKPPSNFHLIVHFENFGSSLEDPSSDREFFINCPSRRFHIDRIESFSEGGGQGVQTTSFGPSDWRKAWEGSQEARIISAVCDPHKIVVAAAPFAPLTRPPTVRPPAATSALASVTTVQEAQPARGIESNKPKLATSPLDPPIRTQRLS
jgi:hypothetical protein